MAKTTILIADDHTLVRETWSLILNTHPAFSVIAEAECAEHAIELAKHLNPDVVIMDINMPGMSGINATQQIQKCSPSSKVLGVSMHTQPMYAREMMQNGARGYVTKNSSREEMFEAISEVQKGNKYICKEIKNIIAEQMLHVKGEAAGINALSKREMEIILYVKKGLLSKEIAEEMNISIKTVEVHRYNILKKLNLKNAAALVNFINTNYHAYV